MWNSKVFKFPAGPCLRDPFLHLLHVGSWQDLHQELGAVFAAEPAVVPLVKNENGKGNSHYRHFFSRDFFTDKISESLLACHSK